MAYDALLPASQATTQVVGGREEFRRIERLVLLIGASTFGAMAGFSATVMTGKQDLWVLLLTAAPVLVLALHLTAESLFEAMRRGARGCAGATMLHGAALLAWPMTTLLTPLGAAIYWIAPLTALSGLVLFASCWGGPARAIYRTGVQGVLVAALAGHQGVLLVMGG